MEFRILVCADKPGKFWSESNTLAVLQATLENAIAVQQPNTAAIARLEGITALKTKKHLLRKFRHPNGSSYIWFGSTKYTKKNSRCISTLPSSYNFLGLEWRLFVGTMLLVLQYSALECYIAGIAGIASIASIVSIVNIVSTANVARIAPCKME